MPEKYISSPIMGKKAAKNVKTIEFNCLETSLQNLSQLCRQLLPPTQIIILNATQLQLLSLIVKAFLHYAYNTKCIMNQ